MRLGLWVQPNTTLISVGTELVYSRLFKLCCYQYVVFVTTCNNYMSISWMADQKAGPFWVFLEDLKFVGIGLKVLSTSVAWLN